MRLSNKITISRLDNALSSFLKGTNLKDWIEREVIHLLNRAGYYGPPVKSFQNLYKERRITSVKYQPGIHPVWGKLDIGINGFTVILSPTYKSKGEFWHKYALAHEIAHTLFYNVKDWPPSSLIYLEPGNRDLEWLCGYIAKCIFSPETWLRNQINTFPTIGSRDFSLDVLCKLSDIFLVPWQIIAERLVEDLLIWNCIILHFSLFIENGVHVWRLNWHTIPSIGTEKLFIPIGKRTQDGIMKYPRAKGAILKYIESLKHHEIESSTSKQRISSNTLNSVTTGNLGKFLSNACGTDDITIYINCNILEQQQLFNSDQLRVQSVIMCLPLQN